MFYFSLYSFCVCITFLCDVSVPLSSNTTCFLWLYFCVFLQFFIIFLGQTVFVFILHLFTKCNVYVSSCHFQMFMHISFYNSLLCLYGNFVRCFYYFSHSGTCFKLFCTFISHLIAFAILFHQSTYDTQYTLS